MLNNIRVLGKDNESATDIC